VADNMEERGSEEDAGEGLGRDTANGQRKGAQECDEDAAMVADTDLERLMDEVVEEGDLEDFMRAESAMEARLRDVEADGEEENTDEARDCNDFQFLKDLSLFHGKIWVKGSKGDRPFFVFKREDVVGALRATCVDTTTSKGQGKDMSKGGYFSTLASIKSIEGNFDADFSPVVHCIKEMRDTYGNDIPKSLFKWLSQKKPGKNWVDCEGGDCPY